MAGMGLSARTQKGHCSNAGGLSAVLRDPLYRSNRFLSPAAIQAFSLTKARSWRLNEGCPSNAADIVR